MSDYQTIKELVIEASMEEGSFPSYEKLTSLVLKHFPTSKWQKTHYAWYKSKIKRGEIEVPGFEGLTHEESIIEGNEDEIQEATVPRPGSAQIVRREISPQQFDNDEDDNTLTHQERGF